MSAGSHLSLFGRLHRPFLVPAKTASAVARSRGQGRPQGRRASRAYLDGDEHGRTLADSGTMARTPRAWRATALIFLLVGCMSLSGPAASLARPDLSPSISLASSMQEASERFGVPVAWIEAVVLVESGGQVGATSPKGAMGLMQIMPPTWRQVSAELGLGLNPYDPRDNVMAGTSYLRQLYDRFGVGGFLAAYNAGPTRYQAFLVGERSLPRETLLYDARVRRQIRNRSLARARPTVQPSLDWRASKLFVERPNEAGQTSSASVPNILPPDPEDGAEK